MNSFTAIFRANPGLTVAAVMCLGFPLVLGLIGLVLRASEGSLRPIVFMAGLMMPLAAVFFITALVRARTPAVSQESSFSLAVADGHFLERTKLFGADIPADQFRDAKSVFPEFFAEAEHAELGIVGTGETTLVAQFPTTDAAKRAAGFLWKWFRATNTSGDEERGWRGKRGLNDDYFEMLRSGRHLFLWTALTKEACAARRAVSDTITSQPDLKPVPPAPFFPALQPLGALFQPVGMKLGGTLLMVALYTLWFFKGSTWASSSPAVAGVPSVTATELAARLEAINALDVPFRIERGTQPNEFFATWRYADAKWVDLARARGMQRTFRIRLVLDEKNSTVRATDYLASFDWSAGRGGAEIEWKAALGIVFFQYEHQRVFGLQLDEQGRFKPELSYAYTFNLNEMKSPLVTAVTQAGWNWRPTVWQGPTWLRWLTE
ncbi:MAG: hypothetical protein AAB370_10505 [Verrucomicrobiota bacterium]